MKLPCALGILVPMFWLGGVPLSAAQPLLDLEWQAPAASDCPTQTEVLDRVRHLVGSAPTHPVRAHAKLQQLDQDRWRLELETEREGARGTRQLEETSCERLTQAAVVVLAWIVQPAFDAAGAPVAKAPTTEGLRTPAALPQAPRPGADPRVRLGFDLAGVADLGTLPSAALGLSGRFRLEGGHVRLGTHLSYWPQSRGVLPDSSAGAVDAGGDFSLLAWGAEACATAWRSQLALCAGPELQRLQGTGFGVDLPREATRWWLAMVTGVEGSLWLTSRAALMLRGDAVIPTRRERFVLDDLGEVHRPGRVNARLYLGLRISP